MTIVHRHVARVHRISSALLLTTEGTGTIRPLAGTLESSPLGRSKIESSGPVKGWLADVSPDAICVFSDGSSDGPARSAWRYSVRKDGSDSATELMAGGGPMSGAEVFDAEVQGAVQGHRAAFRLLPQSRGRIYVLLDNQAAVHALTTGWSSSSQHAVAEFYTYLLAGGVAVLWITGHSKIPGNERADALAKGALGALPKQIPSR